MVLTLGSFVVSTGFLNSHQDGRMQHGSFICSSALGIQHGTDKGNEHSMEGQDGTQVKLEYTNGIIVHSLVHYV